MGTGLKNKLRNGVARMSKLVIGAGRSGIAAASFLARQGFSVTLSDLKCPTDFPELAKEVRLVWGKQTGELLLGVDQVIISPGIPLEIPIIQLAKEQAIEVIGELELFYRNCSLPILAVTGTNGKTTTATLLAKMIEKMGKPVLLGGNIGKALSEEADHLPEEGFVVLEVSSYQLEATKDFVLILQEFSI
jgi:UDP-N-acetylmuramoylalanine--D-glutamate ligase